MKSKAPYLAAPVLQCAGELQLKVVQRFRVSQRDRKLEADARLNGDPFQLKIIVQ
jgi:hypothetical protein